MAGIHALEADLVGQGDHGRARGLIARASKNRRLFAARRIAGDANGSGFLVDEQLGQKVNTATLLGSYG